jgi:hypothetical protein
MPMALRATRAYSLLIEPKGTDMTILDLTKATLVCGTLAVLIYSFPVVGQVVIIAFLSLLWLSYARKTLQDMRRR